VHAQKGQQHQLEKSRQLQRGLCLAAKRSKERRFHALYDRMSRPDVLWRAWMEVRANGGSAGVDGITIDEIEKEVREFLARLTAELKGGKYRPKPVLRVHIPKPDGTTRPLGIPTVKDRVVQQAAKIVLEPIFEADFRDNSYGFRPKRSAHQALSKVKTSLVRGWWVVDADIKGYFDSIDHELLVILLKRRISDRRALRLIRGWLRAGVVENGVLTPTYVGSPQGGVISPLLANIFLHVLDECWERSFSHLGQIIRYADDFVIICEKRYMAKEALKRVAQILSRLKLTLHPIKTRIADMAKEGFDFLGMYFRKQRGKLSGKLAPFMWPSAKAMKAARAKLRQLTSRRDLRYAPSEIVKSLNPVIRGWRNYFTVGNSTKKLQDLDRYVRHRLHILMSARTKRGYLGQARYDTWLKGSGIQYFYQPGTCGPRP